MAKIHDCAEVRSRHVGAILCFGMDAYESPTLAEFDSIRKIGVRGMSKGAYFTGRIEGTNCCFDLYRDGGAWIGEANVSGIRHLEKSVNRNAAERRIIGSIASIHFGYRIDWRR